MRRSPVHRRPALDAESDAALATAAAEGDADAFEELYRRHAPTAWRVAQAVARNADDTADAVAEAFTRVFRTLRDRPAGAPGVRFRPYLLTATRHAAVDIVRRRSRLQPQDEVVAGGRVAGAAEVAVAREESALVARAFDELPERWRSALWLIDVEHLSARDAGSILGVEPNNAAQLAARARGRLRERYLQAHVPNHIRPLCRDVVAGMGGYLAGTAPSGRRAMVDAHVQECAECAERLAHVRDLGIPLRRALLPLPLLLHRRVLRSWTQNRRPPRQSLVDTASSRLAAVPEHVPGDGWGVLVQQLSASSPLVERLVAGASAAVLVAGLSVASVKGPDPEPRPSGGEVAAASAPGRGVDPGGGAAGALLPLPAGPVAPGATTAAGATTATAGPAAGESIVSASSPSEPAGPGPAAGQAPATPAAATSTAAGSPLASALAPVLQGPVLAGTDLAGAVLPGVDLSGVDLTGTVLSGADLTGAELRGTLLSGADLTGAALPGADLTGAALSGAALDGVDLTGALLNSVDLSSATLSGSALPQVDLTGADLDGALLRTADLSNAVLSDTTLVGTDLTKALLAGADLRGADLTGAVLTGADLTGADLTGADLTSANLLGATGAGADLLGAAVPEVGGNGSDILDGARSLVPTTLPGQVAATGTGGLLGRPAPVPVPLTALPVPMTVLAVPPVGPLPTPAAVLPQVGAPLPTTAGTPAPLAVPPAPVLTPLVPPALPSALDPSPLGPPLTTAPGTLLLPQMTGAPGLPNL